MLFCRQVGFVFGGKELLVAFEYGVAGYVFARFGAENDAYGRIVAFGTVQFVVHAYIHVHLSHVLMGDGSYFEVYQHVALQYDVVEDEVDVVVLCVRSHQLLPSHEGKSSSEFHQKFLEEALVGNITFKLLGGTMPCQIMVNGFCFNIYVKVLSSAHFKGSEDVWRVQLPQHDDFSEMKTAPIPFIFLGYDSENDVYATWNPHVVKQRLNEAKYVSFYSRLSGQQEAHDEDKFVRKQLNNDGEVLIFPRSKLNSYLVNFASYFPDNTEYVAIGSKRRKEANDAYRIFNDSRNLSAFAKYLEQNGCHNISEYCKLVKTFINHNVFSCHRKIFLACDSILQYEEAVKRFLAEEDVQGAINVTDVNSEDVLDAYVLFLSEKMEEKPMVESANAQKTLAPKVQTTESCLKNGKIIKIEDQALLQEIEPYLNTEYRKPIPAMHIVKDYYEAIYPDLRMEIKDWVNLINQIDWIDSNQ